MSPMKETYISSKELNKSANEQYKSAKVLYISAKETCVDFVEQRDKGLG